jgi:Predicted transcriptional regulators
MLIYYNAIIYCKYYYNATTNFRQAFVFIFYKSNNMLPQTATNKGQNMKNDVSKIFLERFNGLMSERNIKQDELAKVLNTTRQSVGQYVKGISHPPADKMVLIADYFDVSVDWLYGRADNRTTDTNLQAICEYTGLGEDFVVFCNKVVTSYDNFMNNEDISKLNSPETMDIVGKSIKNDSDRTKSIIDFLQFLLLNDLGREFLNFCNQHVKGGNDKVVLIDEDGEKEYAQAELLNFYIHDAIDYLRDLKDIYHALA